MTAITESPRICVEAEYSLLVSARRHRPEPLDPPMVPFLLVGTGVWAVAGLILLGTGAPTPWRWTCLAGVLLGLVMLPPMVIRDRRRRRQASGGSTSTSLSS